MTHAVPDAARAGVQGGDAGADRLAAIPDASVPLGPELFIRKLVRQLAGTLEEVVGLEVTTGYVAAVGSDVGQWIDDMYHEALGERPFDLREIASICVDFKNRIGGAFHIIALEDDRIVFGNHRCPFNEHVHDRPSLCMMTSNVFGRLAADNLGYARVQLERTIASGAPECRVVVHLTPRPHVEPDEREYYRLPALPRASSGV